MQWPTLTRTQWALCIALLMSCIMYSWNEKDPGGGATLDQHEYGTLCRVAVMVDTGVIVSAFVSSSFAMIQTAFPHLAKSSPLSLCIAPQ